MSMRPADLTGKRFGRLVVLRMADERSKDNCVQWICRCDCGTVKAISTHNIKRVHSCGCYKDEVFKRDHVTHGQSDTNLYHVWASMKGRCKNKNNPAYKNYGGRGITVCEEWLDFSNFYEWSMSNGYGDNLSIDRIDNDGNYEPDNCRWITLQEQQNNKRTNKFIRYKGEVKTPSEWAHLYGVNAKMVCQRVALGWDIERALTEPCHTEFRRKNYGRENTSS